MTLVLMLLAATPISLDEVRAASRLNVQAIQAELAVDQAATGKATARSAILPRVDFSAGASVYLAGPQRVFSTVPTVDSAGAVTFEQRAVEVPGFTRGNYALGLTISQLLYDGGRWWNQIAQANSQIDAAQGQLEEQRLASELEAVRRFYELVRAQLTIKVLQASVERSRDQFARATSLYEAGRGQRRDVLDAEVNLGNDEISVMRQEQAVTSAQVDLLQWLGRPVDDIEAVVPPAVDPHVVLMEAPSHVEALAIARDKRPLLKALAAQVRAGEASIEVARSGYFPSVGVNAGYNRNSPTADPFFTDITKQNSVSLGVSLNWNLFAGFGTDAAAESARVQWRQSVAQHQQAVVELESELRRTLHMVTTQVHIAALAEKNSRLAASELEVEVGRFNAGVSSNIDVRNAQTKVTQAQLTQLQGRIDVEIARAALQRVAGARVEKSP